MKHTSFSISRKETIRKSKSFGDTTLYRFFFRTDWLEPDDANIVLQELQKSFPSPGWRITINERTTTATSQTLP